MKTTKIAFQEDAPNGPYEVDGKSLSPTEFDNLQKMYPHVQWTVIRFVAPEDYVYPENLNNTQDE